MALKYIIFDFDGVIADSMAVFLATYDRIHADFALPDLSPKEIKYLRNFPAKEIFKKFNLSKWMLLKLFWRFRQEMFGKLDHLPIFPGIAKTIIVLHKKVTA